MHIHTGACTRVYTHTIYTCTCMHTYIYSCINIHLNTVINNDIFWRNYTYMYIYINTYIVCSPTYIHTDVHVCMLVYVCMLCICMHVYYVCMYMYVCMCVCMCVYVCVYVCMYVCVCIHVYVCMHNILGELSGGKFSTQNGRWNCPGELSMGELSYTRSCICTADTMVVHTWPMTWPFICIRIGFDSAASLQGCPDRYLKT